MSDDHAELVVGLIILSVSVSAGVVGGYYVSNWWAGDAAASRTLTWWGVFVVSSLVITPLTWPLVFLASLPFLRR